MKIILKTHAFIYFTTWENLTWMLSKTTTNTVDTHDKRLDEIFTVLILLN
jgi:hypothetical protein